MTRKKSERHMRRAAMAAALIALLAGPEASFADASRTGELRIAGGAIQLRAGKAAEKAPVQEARAESKASKHERRRGDKGKRRDQSRMESRQDQAPAALAKQERRRDRRHGQNRKDAEAFTVERQAPAARPVPKPVAVSKPAAAPEAKASAVQTADAGKSPAFAGRKIDAGKAPAFSGRQIVVAGSSASKAQEAPAPARHEDGASAMQASLKDAGAAPGKNSAVRLDAILGEEERVPAAAGGSVPQAASAPQAPADVLAAAKAGRPVITFLRPGDFAYAARFGAGAARLFQRIEDARREALKMRELNRSIAAGGLTEEDKRRLHVGAPSDGGAAQAGLLAVKGSPKLDGRTAPSASEERRAALRAHALAARDPKAAPAAQAAPAPEAGTEKSLEREVETMLGDAFAAKGGRLAAGRSLSLPELGGSRRERILIREWKGGRPMPKRELQETLRAVTKVLTPDGKWCGDAVTALLMETAAVETDFGEIVRQRGGPAKSPWQLLNMNYSELPRYFAKRNPDLMRRADSLYDHSKTAEWNKVHNVPWTAAMCLLHYEQATGGGFMKRLGSLEERACLWKKSYNTYLGAGTVAGYKKKANLHLYR